MNRRKLALPALGVALLGVLAIVTGCSKKTSGGGAGAPAAPARGDGLFLAEAPVVVPDEVLPDLDAMAIGRLYVAGASLSPSGKITPFPPPPVPITRPVVYVLMGEPGAADQLSGAKGELTGEAWGTALAKAISDAKSWAPQLVGVHVHILPLASQAEPLGAALKAVKRNVALPVSVTITADAPSEAWKPLAGKVDELLIFSFGRRPESADRMVSEPTDALTRGLTIPFRYLIVPGGYGFAGNGQAFAGRKLGDGDIDPLSEDRNLDFDFGQILSNDPGNVYNFKPKRGSEGTTTLLSQDGGFARFQVLGMPDLVKHLGAIGKLGGPAKGRVFLVDGVPKDGHVIGFTSLRALLSGKPYDPTLDVKAQADASGKGWAEFSLVVSNLSPASTELSHYNNRVQIRLEEGAFQAVKAGDFDRFDLLESDAEKAAPATFGRASVCRLYENFFAPEETNRAGPIRITGVKPRAFVSFKLTLPDGRAVSGPEKEISLLPPPPPTRVPGAKKPPAKR